MKGPNVEQLASRFAAMGHAARLTILRRLLVAHPDGMVAGDIRRELEIPASTLSHHLDALRQVDLVEQSREGRFLRYRAGDTALRELLDFLYAECCGQPAMVQITLPSQRRSENP